MDDDHVNTKKLPSAEISHSSSDESSALLNYDKVPLPAGWERKRKTTGKGFWYSDSAKKGQKGQIFHPYDRRSIQKACDTFIENAYKVTKTMNTSISSADESSTAAATKEKSRATTKAETIMMSATIYDNVIAEFKLNSLISNLDSLRMPQKCVKVDEKDKTALYVQRQVAILVRIIECKVEALDSGCDDFLKQYEGIKKSVLENEFQIIFKTNWLRPRISQEDFVNFHSLAPSKQIETINTSGKETKSTTASLRDNARKKFVDITKDPVFERELKNQIRKSIIVKGVALKQRAAAPSPKPTKRKIKGKDSGKDTDEDTDEDAGEDADEDSDDADDESDDAFFDKILQLNEGKSKESISTMNIPKFEFAVTEMDKRYSSGIFLYCVSEIDRYMLTFAPMLHRIKKIQDVCIAIVFII